MALTIPETVALIVSNVEEPPDLLSCACVNSTWSLPALKKLYNGSMNDMQYRTPDIGSLNCLFVASPERFARYMSLVKHLIITSDCSAPDEVAYPENRHACMEKCRALRHYKDAERIMRPKAKGPLSLAIPLEIMDQDLSSISELILHPDVRYLTIDGVYCELFVSSIDLQQRNSFSNRISNLRALTVFRSSSTTFKMDHLCRLLEKCDLEMFSLQQRQSISSLTRSDFRDLLRRLQRCGNLRALSLMIPLHETDVIPVQHEENGGQIEWPRLKALYLNAADPSWLKKLPRFRNLQILRLGRLVPQNADNIKIATDNIAKCHELRAFDADFPAFDVATVLLVITRGCPLLRKLCFRIREEDDSEMTKDQFSRLLQALPLIEFLELGTKFAMDGSSLRDVADHCPRLAVIKLFRACMHLSFESLAEMAQIRSLELMELRSVWFQNPRQFRATDKLQNLASAWRRVFPRLKSMPCPADIYRPTDIDFGDARSEEGSRASSVGFDEVADQPELNFSDYNSDWVILRVKLWRLLGYDRVDSIFERMSHMCQTNLEIKTFGAPVMPLDAFFDPINHSSSEKREE